MRTDEVKVDEQGNVDYSDFAAAVDDATFNGPEDWIDHDIDYLPVMFKQSDGSIVQAASVEFVNVPGEYAILVRLK